MFEKTVLRRSGDAESVTPGAIAEAMLFYQNVHLILDRGTFTTLLKTLGIEPLLSLMQRPGFSAAYCEEDMITHSVRYGAFTVHKLDAMKFVGHESVGDQLPDVGARLAYLIEQAGTRKADARKFARELLERVPVRSLSGDFYVRGGVSAAARADLANEAYTREAVRTVISMVPGGYLPPPDFKFDVIDTDIGFHVFTNLDLDGINARRAAMTPSPGPIGIAYAFAHIAAARADLALAAHYGGDFSTSDVASKLIEIRHADMLRRAHINDKEISNFVEVTLPDTPSLRDAIDAGDQTFGEFLNLLDKAARFKRWLGDARADEGLVREYIKGVTSEPWVQRLPARTMRYVLTQAADLILSRPAAVIAGLADNFLIDKLLGGWRPNHFVESRLGPFLRRE